MRQKFDRKLWVEIIRRWRKSGLSQRRFCEEEKVTLSTFRYHYKRSNAKSSFIELPTSFNFQTSESLIEIIHPVSGITLRIPHGFCEETLKRLLAVLGDLKNVC